MRPALIKVASALQQNRRDLSRAVITSKEFRKRAAALLAGVPLAEQANVLRLAALRGRDEARLSLEGKIVRLKVAQHDTQRLLEELEDFKPVSDLARRVAAAEAALEVDEASREVPGPLQVVALADESFVAPSAFPFDRKNVVLALRGVAEEEAAGVSK